MTRTVKYSINYERNGVEKHLYLNNGNECVQTMIALADSFAISKKITATSEIDGQILLEMDNGKLTYIATDFCVMQIEEI